MKKLQVEIQKSKNIDLNNLLDKLRQGDNQTLLKISEFKENNDKNFRQFVLRQIMNDCKRQQQHIYERKTAIYLFLEDFFKNSNGNFIGRKEREIAQDKKQNQSMQEIQEMQEQDKQDCLHSEEQQRQIMVKLEHQQIKLQNNYQKPIIYVGNSPEQSESQNMGFHHNLIQKQGQNKNMQQMGYQQKYIYLSLENKQIQNKNDHEEENSQPDNSNCSNLQKTKKIHRNNHQNIKKSTIPKKKTFCFEKIEIKAEGQVIVYNIINYHRVFSTINKNVRNLKAIHIFDNKFTTEACVKKVLNSYPSLQILTLNCVINFKIIQKLKYELSRLKQLRIFGSYQRFYVEYHSFNHFPIQPIQKKNTMLQLLPDYFLLSNDKTYLFLSNKYKNNKYSSNSLQQIIKNIHNTGTHLKYLDISGQILKFQIENRVLCSLKNLVMLKVQQYVSWGQNDNMVIILSYNKGLQHLAINFQTKLEQRIISRRIIKALKCLIYLKSLSMSATHNKIIIDYDVFKLTRSLTYLNFQKIIFKKDLNIVKHLQFLRQLKHLRYLSLPYCQPINSSIFQDINSVCFPRLVYLNLSHTQVDNTCIKYLARMTNLEYLNLDCTRVDSQVLSEVFKNYCEMYLRHHPLKYLSIKKELAYQHRIHLKTFLAVYYSELLEGRYQTCSLKDISLFAEFLPDLQYINIAFNVHLSLFDFSKFMNLKMIAMDAITSCLMRCSKQNYKIYIIDQ